MTLAELIKMWQTKRADALKAQEALAMKAATDGEGRTFTDEEQREFDDLGAQIGKIDQQITSLESLSERLSKEARPAGVENKSGDLTDEELEAEAARIRAGGSPAVIKRRHEDAFEGQSFTRKCIAEALSFVDRRSPVVIARERWGKSDPMLVEVIKADVEGHSSVTGEPGAELVSTDAKYTGDFLDFLYAQTVFDRLALREVPANVSIKGIDGAATGYWVGEGKAIPASEISAQANALGRLKVAGLAVMSLEWLRDSSPSGELVVRDALVEALSQATDSKFFSADAAVSGVSPAGILNGIASLGSNGYALDNVYEDLQELFNAFISAKNAGGDLNFVMNKSLAQALALMRNALGQKAFPELTRNGGNFEGVNTLTGDNIDANTIALVKPRDIYKIGDEGLRIEVSRDATIEMSDAPAQDILGPTSPTGKTANMFQTDSVAIKTVRSINFARRRSSAVAYIDDADYGNSASVTA